MFLKRKRKNENTAVTRLWTKNFIILFIGSFFSMVGDNAMDTIFGLMILDLTDSGVLYSLVLIIENVLRIIVPVSIGTYIEKCKKEKVAYLTDFSASALFLVLALVCHFKIVSESSLLIMKAMFDVTCIIYSLNYESFFPAIVDKEVYPKAVSIGSVMGNCSEVASLVGLLGYERYGMIPVLLFSSACYFIAACLGLRIKPKENTASNNNVQSVKDIYLGYKEAWQYVKKTEGFRSFLIYDFSDVFRTGAMNALLLPCFEKYYRSNQIFGFSLEFDYICVVIFTFLSIGEFWGGVIGYGVDLKRNNRLKAQIIIGIVEVVTMAFAPLTSLPLTLVLMLLTGIASIITASINDSVFFENIPPDMRGRFNGAFDSISTVVAILGNFAGGIILDCVKYPGWGFLMTSIPQFVAMILLLCLRAKPLNAFFRGDKRVLWEQESEE